jgi:hypothetical protein
MTSFGHSRLTGRFWLDDERPDAGRTPRRQNLQGVRLHALDSSNSKQPRQGDNLKYALLIYQNLEIDQRAEAQRREVNSGIAEILERPNVTGWLRLHHSESATTVRYEQGRTLLTDGPFLDSKDYLGGFIVVEAENLDGALALADELQELRSAGAIEVRPVREEPLVGA